MVWERRRRNTPFPSSTPAVGSGPRSSPSPGSGTEVCSRGRGGRGGCAGKELSVAACALGGRVRVCDCAGDAPTARVGYLRVGAARAALDAPEPIVKAVLFEAVLD